MVGCLDCLPKQLLERWAGLLVPSIVSLSGAMAMNCPKNQVKAGKKAPLILQILQTQNPFLQMPEGCKKFQTVHAFRGSYTHGATRSARNVAGLCFWNVVLLNYHENFDVSWGSDETTKTLQCLLACTSISSLPFREQFGFVAASCYVRDVRPAEIRDSLHPSCE